MPHTLLAADDSATIRRVIELTFADRDITVVTVGDGDAAVRSLDTAPPDIVLADIHMPGQSGYEVARHVQNAPGLSHIPVMLLAGAFEPVDHSLATSLGCAGVLTKPLDPQFVIRRVTELLASPKAPAAVAVADAPGPIPAETSGDMPAVVSESEAVETAIDLAPAWAASVEFAPLEVVPGVPQAPETVDEHATTDATLPASEDPMAASGESVESSPLAAEHELRTADIVSPAPEKGRDVEAYFEALDQRLTHLVRDERPALRVVSRVPDEPSEDPSGSREPAPTAPASAAIRQVASGPALVDAFSALLAAERGSPGQSAGAARSGPVSSPPDEELLDRVARRALDRLSEDSIRAMVERVVSDTAERLIREEIERIKSNIK